MPDNDIRTQLARVLWNHLLLPNPPQCGCGQPVTHTQAWNEHVADVVLATPGIAVVAVPAGELWDAIDLLIELAGPRAFAAGEWPIIADTVPVTAFSELHSSSPTDDPATWLAAKLRQLIETLLPPEQAATDDDE